MTRTFATGLLGLWLCCSCATPIEIKQATSALDTAYADNIELMRQYRDTVDSINQLHHSWSRYIKSRHLLNLAVQCAALEQEPAKLPVRQALLGPELIAWVNLHRLASLPAQGKLEAGKGDMTGLVQGLPALIPLIKAKVQAGLAADQEFQSLGAFAEYEKNVMVLKTANLSVREYLDVDVTVSKEDFRSLTEAVQQLGKKP